MKTSRIPHHRADAWEWWRQRAWEVHEQGWWQKDSAAALGVSTAAVCEWLKRRREGGEEALHTRLRPRRPSKLTAEPWAQLPPLPPPPSSPHALPARPAPPLPAPPSPPHPP